MFYVEVQWYSDFGGIYTEAILVSEIHTKESMKSLMQMFSDKMRFNPHEEFFTDDSLDTIVTPQVQVESDGISGVCNEQYENYRPQQLVTFLKKQGFKYVKTHEVCISD